MDNFVSVPMDEYLQMVEDVRWLRALESAGVDNWDGISYASELFNEE